MAGQAAVGKDTADETALLARATSGDEQAVRTLIRRYNQRLYRIARSVLRDADEAEDALQQAYFQAFTSLSGFRAESRFSTWLSRIVLNEALDRLRRRKRTPRIASMDDVAADAQIIPFPNAPVAPDPERRLAQSEITKLLEHAIDELPAPFRVVLVARLVEGMSVQETATLLQLKPETVKTRLHRARLLVRAALERRVGPALTNTFPFDGWRCERMADMVVQRLGIGS
jgi:RNA polymerase sigma-70 factor (ECF subfamily)